MAMAGAAKDPSHLPDANGRILQFDSKFDLSSVTLKFAEAKPAGTPENPALRIKTEANKGWPGVEIPVPSGYWDLSEYESITMDIHNVDNHDIDVFVRVDNTGSEKDSMTERIGTQPDQRVTLTITLKRASKSNINLSGMNGYPQGLYNSGGIDPSHIVRLVFFTGKGDPSSSSFEISNIRATGKYQQPTWLEMSEKDFFPFIDLFGQFRFKNWPGKITKEEELVKAREAEAKRLETTAKGPTDWDKWGGWTRGPKLNATGNFRTEKYRNKWWLVDPDGYLFFSVGVTCVGFGGGETPFQGRDNWFELPKSPSDPLLAVGKSAQGYSHAKANLVRKYGPGWKESYPEIIHKRLRAWGINTIGNWSNGQISQMKRTPYTATFFYNVAKLKNKFPDVFDPSFATALDKGAAQFLKGTTTDPWCIGYFVDNEMPWGGDTDLARTALAGAASQPAKQRLGTWLQERYKTVDALNKAWGTSWNNWAAFAEDTSAKPTAAPAVKDLTDFTGLIAETYFKSIREAVKKAAPKKLYLGCRCVGGSANMVAAAVKYCDVISYNRYCASVRDIRLPNNADAPVMIGEFHFGALDRGPFWTGLFTADSQQDRARMYTQFVQSGLDNPQIVGVHWFQYADEPTTGRNDGENGQVGFVDTCDTPYEETINASRACAEGMYRRRADGR